MFEFVVIDDEVELALAQPVITNDKSIKSFFLSFLIPPLTINTNYFYITKNAVDFNKLSAFIIAFHIYHHYFYFKVICIFVNSFLFLRKDS